MSERLREPIDAGDRGWKRRFDDPIPLPRGRQLVTLEDAGRYITKLPKAEHGTAEWQAAMEALILVATSGGLTMFDGETPIVLSAPEQVGCRFLDTHDLRDISDIQGSSKLVVRRTGSRSASLPDKTDIARSAQHR